MKQLLLILGCFYFLMPSSTAQIEELKDGVLVVRLKSNNRKINALKESLAKTPNPNLERQLVTAELEAFHTAKAMMQAFEQAYQFSEVLFMHDTATTALKNEQYERIFLDKDLKPTVEADLSNRFFCVLVEGKSVSGAEGYVVLDSQFEAIPRPFPNFVRRNNLGYLMNSFFADNSMANLKLYSRLAKKLNKRLDFYYAKR